MEVIQFLVYIDIPNHQPESIRKLRLSSAGNSYDDLYRRDYTAKIKPENNFFATAKVIYFLVYRDIPTDQSEPVRRLQPPRAGNSFGESLRKDYTAKPKPENNFSATAKVI